MITRADPREAEWFRDWKLQDYASPVNDSPLPGHYPHVIAILHPGCFPTGDPQRPFHRNDADDPRLTEAQSRTIERILIAHSGPGTACTFALYAGYLDREDLGRRQGFDEPDATWVTGNLWFTLFAADAQDALFSATQRRWDCVHIVELSHVWPHDRSWFLASEPDLAYTVIGCDETLARELLGVPDLNAHPWPH